MNAKRPRGDAAWWTLCVGLTLIGSVNLCLNPAAVGLLHADDPVDCPCAQGAGPPACDPGTPLVCTDAGWHCDEGCVSYSACDAGLGGGDDGGSSSGGGSGGSSGGGSGSGGGSSGGGSSGGGS